LLLLTLPFYHSFYCFYKNITKQWIPDKFLFRLLAKEIFWNDKSER